MKSKLVDGNQEYRRAADTVSDAADSISGMAEEGAQKAKKVLNQTSETVKNGLESAQKNVAKYVKENPFIALGISLLAGIVLGEILKK